jgi:hypothetical protein
MPSWHCRHWRRPCSSIASARCLRPGRSSTHVSPQPPGAETYRPIGPLAPVTSNGLGASVGSMSAPPVSLAWSGGRGACPVEAHPAPGTAVLAFERLWLMSLPHPWQNRGSVTPSLRVTFGACPAFSITVGTPTTRPRGASRITGA